MITLETILYGLAVYVVAVDLLGVWILIQDKRGKKEWYNRGVWAGYTLVFLLMSALTVGVVLAGVVVECLLALF